MKTPLLALVAFAFLLPTRAAAQDVIVPDLSALRSVSEMQATLTQAGLLGRFVEGPVPETPERTNRVQGQNPGPGSRVPRGSTVTVTIYKRPCPPVPSFIGMTVESASGFIDQCGLVVGGVELANNPPTPEQAGKVFYQEPAAGSPLVTGTRVLLKRYTGFTGQSSSRGSSSTAANSGTAAGGNSKVVFDGTMTILSDTSEAGRAFIGKASNVRFTVEMRGSQWYVQQEFRNKGQSAAMCGVPPGKRTNDADATLEDLLEDAEEHMKVPIVPVAATKDGNTLRYQCAFGGGQRNVTIAINGDRLTGEELFRGGSDVTRSTIRATRAQ